MDFMALLQNFGLPVAVAAFFIWQFIQQGKEYVNFVKDIAAKAIDAINKSTEVDVKMLNVAERLEKRLDNERGN